LAGETNLMTEPQQYNLRIDGALLRRQQRLLAKIIDTANRGSSYAVETATDRGLLEGILDLLEAIDEQALPPRRRRRSGQGAANRPRNSARKGS
jgi:hypothetical protein